MFWETECLPLVVALSAMISLYSADMKLLPRMRNLRACIYKYIEPHFLKHEKSVHIFTFFWKLQNTKVEFILHIYYLRPKKNEIDNIPEWRKAIKVTENWDWCGLCVCVHVSIGLSPPTPTSLGLRCHWCWCCHFD